MENIEEWDCEHLQYTKLSPLQFLRQQEKKHRKCIKREKRKIKRRAHLAEYIYQNNNIFQLIPQRFNRKAAQNIIWEKNYKLKMAINILKEDNSSLKARLWNFQKENRKMDKQIETWNLQKLFHTSRKKPYIDMATVSKVFTDQDYEIVSHKIEIARLEQTLEQKEEVISKLTQSSKKIQCKELIHHNFILSQQKLEFFNQIKQIFTFDERTLHDDEFQSQVIGPKYESLTKSITEISDQSELLKKKIELKRKANLAHRNQYEGYCKQTENYSNVNEEQVSKMKQMMRKIILEQQKNVKDMKKDVKAAHQLVMNEECRIQDVMGQFIQKKIELSMKIREIRDKMGNRNQAIIVSELP